tara:strand:+ start:765 stop:1205 length:441 start_codon:yes stop_codon:yes gene_type:complete
MANQSTKQIARLGGEEQVVTLFGNVFNALQNAQPGLNSEDITTLILNSYGGVLNQISPAKYDYILGVFTSAGLGEQIAKAYALLCIDAVKTLNISFDQLFESTTDPIAFSNLGLTLINHYRPITSQVGTVLTVSQTPNHIKRMIAY